MDELDLIEDDLMKDIESMDIPKGDEYKKDTDDMNGSKQEDNSGYNKYGNHSGNKFAKKKKGIDLFKDEVTPKAIDFKDMKVSKSFLFSVGNQDLVISEEDKKVITAVLTKLKNKNLRIRVMCNSATLVWDIITKIFDEEDITIIKPWEKYCDSGDITSWIPTDDNKQAAAMYYKNFDNLPTVIKTINSATMACFFGKKNNSVVEYNVVYDPNSTKQKIAFKESRDSANFLWLPIMMKDQYGISTYNIANKDELSDFIQVIK